jgi:WD40 repeat protein
VRWREEGLRGRVGAVAFSPDGKSVAVGGSGPVKDYLDEAGRAIGHKVVSEVRLWDVATASLRWTWEGVLGSVNSLAFSPDGKTLVVCDSGAVEIVDAGAGKTERTLMKTTTRSR